MSETGGLFPFDDTEDFDEEINDLEEGDDAEDYIIRDFEIDWDTMTLTGNIVEGLDAIVQWVNNALRTKRYEWTIYSWDFGEEYTDLIGNSFSQEYLNNECDRLITECLQENPYIQGIEDLVVTLEGDHLSISFTLITDLGEVEIDV